MSHFECTQARYVVIIYKLHTNLRIDGEYLPPSFDKNDLSNLVKPRLDMIRSKYLVFSGIDVHTSNLNRNNVASPKTSTNQKSNIYIYIYVSRMC